MGVDEKIIWEGGPSQWVNFPTFLAGIFVITIPWVLWRYLVVRFWRFEITDHRITIEKGVLSRQSDELELYRVKDIRLHQPFWLRLVGLSNLVLSTSDVSHRTLVIPGVRNGKELRGQLRDAVEKRRDVKGVRETDFN